MVIEWVDPSNRDKTLQSIEQTMERIEPGAKFVKQDDDQTEGRDWTLWRFLMAAFIFWVFGFYGGKGLIFHPSPIS